MRMPDELRQAIAEETERISRAELVRATAELTEHYRLGNAGSPVKTAAHRAAYLAVRFPATLAATENVFAELHRLAPEVVIGSILDLGAGPGTAMLAAAQVFPSLREATLVEADPGFIEMGKRLLRAAQPAECKVLDARWVQHDLRSGLQVPAHDVVVISYATGELAQSTAQTVLAQAWNLARQFLVVLEPGTPRGFGIVHAARSLLIAERGFILAPCPHQQACPMSAAGDWCHFSQRVERTSSHRV
ncbi:MAG TPA: small ribosomal subunit Rsm22 family protein, partial [Alphaproteobacteria bacterium]|nr:small ribosomal subunit Rsm22 family protein [Alphaproteobacteria bacterium]